MGSFLLPERGKKGFRNDGKAFFALWIHRFLRELTRFDGTKKKPVTKEKNLINACEK